MWSSERQSRISRETDGATGKGEQVMTGYLKTLCILFALGFLLVFAGFCAFEAKLPILGVILGGSGILSFLSTLLVPRREEQKNKEEEDR